MPTEPIVEIRKVTTQDKFDIIEYLQNDIKTKGIKADSFWHNLDVILDARRDGTLVVITVDGKLVGYIAYSYEYMRESEIDILEILPPYRRKGYGRKLVEWVENDLNTKWSNECNGRSGCIIDFEALSGSEEFWLAMGYCEYNIYDTNNTYFQKELDPPAKRIKKE